MGYTSRVKLGLVMTAAFVAVLTASPIVRAESPERSAARVRVDAPADCATPTTFWRALADRTDRLRAPEGAETAATIDVVIKRQGTRVRGELRVARAGERTSTRSLGGASCAEVTDGLSLVAALAFDPGAKLVRTSEAPGTETKTEADAETKADVEPRAGADAKVDPIVEPSPAAERPVASAPRTTTRWGAAIFGGGLGTGAPDVSFAAGAVIDLELDRAGLWSPLLRAGAIHARGSTDGPLDASLAWTFGRASVCPLRVVVGGGLALRPCASIDVGVMNAEAPDVKSARASARPWVAPGLEVLARWTVARPLFVEGRLGASAPLVRDELVIDPTLTLYRAPAVVPWAHGGVGVSFP